MEECELCGKKISKVYSVEIDGVILGVCTGCSQGKHVLGQRDTKPAARPAVPSRSARPQQQDQELVQGYGEMIKRARERIGLPLKVVAERINEKESYLARVEEQHAMPTIELTSKLEKFLGIKLTQATEQPEHGAASSPKARHASLGEFA